MLKIWCKCPCEQGSWGQPTSARSCQWCWRKHRGRQMNAWSFSWRRILSGVDRPVGEVHEPDVYQDVRPALHTELTPLPGAVCGAAQILFWLYFVLFKPFTTYLPISTQHKYTNTYKYILSTLVFTFNSKNHNCSVRIFHLNSQIRSWNK